MIEKVAFMANVVTIVIGGASFFKWIVKPIRNSRSGNMEINITKAIINVMTVLICITGLLILINNVIVPYVEEDRIRTTLEDYEDKMVKAINKGDFTFVSELILEDIKNIYVKKEEDKLGGMQESLVDYLSVKGIKEEFLYSDIKEFSEYNQSSLERNQKSIYVEVEEYFAISNNGYKFKLDQEADYYILKDNNSYLLYRIDNVNILCNPYTKTDKEFIFPSACLERLDDEEIRNVDSSIIPYAKMEIYARHGCIFDDVDIQKYFESKPWYWSMNKSIDSIELSTVEKNNIIKINKILDNEI